MTINAPPVDGVRTLVGHLRRHGGLGYDRRVVYDWPAARPYVLGGMPALLVFSAAGWTHAYLRLGRTPEGPT